MAMYMRMMAALLAISVWPLVVEAQDSSLTLTPAPEATYSVGNPVPGPMTLECYQTQSMEGFPMSLRVESDAYTSSGVRCYQVYPIGGGIASVPYTVTDPNFAPTNQWTSGAPEATALEGASNTTQTRAKNVLLPAILGSLAGIALLGILMAWHLRRSRRRAESSRARHWAEKNWNSIRRGRNSLETGDLSPGAPYAFSTPQRPDHIPTRGL